MKLTEIKEAGANNILMMAINNGASIKEDTPLISLINNELFYLVTLEDVNLFELFRLSQSFRDKIRIINEKPADVPSPEELKISFPGESVVSDNGTDTSVNLSDAAKHVIMNFINLTSQMNTDDDIISTGAARLFLPMMSRKFDIQFPMSFIDLIDSMSKEESARLFTKDYPNTIDEILTEQSHGVKTMISLGFVQLTSILKYNERYDKLLKTIKYSPLKSQQTSKMYKMSLLGFERRDNISRGMQVCSLFNANQSTLESAMKRMSRLKTPLELKFVVQMPIQYMQLLLNSFSSDILPIIYESSMTTILDDGLVYEDFKSSQFENDESEEGMKKLEEHNEAISAYRTRITEANQIMLNILPVLIKSETDVNITHVFSLMPSLYMATAVISYNTEYSKKYLEHTDPLIVEMFQEMDDISRGVIEDINKTK
jgi:hypothetical protein